MVCALATNAPPLQGAQVHQREPQPADGAAARAVQVHVPHGAERQPQQADGHQPQHIPPGGAQGGRPGAGCWASKELQPVLCRLRCAGVHGVLLTHRSTVWVRHSWLLVLVLMLAAGCT